ncbi:MAG: hypothetical protein ACI9E1_000854 [Cryomorphaceae bacterium]|jgi:hypothetical protein
MKPVFSESDRFGLGTQYASLNFGISLHVSNTKDRTAYGFIILAATP